MTLYCFPMLIVVVDAETEADDEDESRMKMAQKWKRRKNVFVNIARILDISGVVKR